MKRADVPWAVMIVGGIALGAPWPLWVLPGLLMLRRAQVRARKV